MEECLSNDLTSIKGTSIQTLCRICGEKTTQYINIFSKDGLEKQLSLKTSSCLQIQVSTTDLLPTVICVPCCNRLDNFYIFFRQAAEVQVYLQDISDTSESILEVEQAQADVELTNNGPSNSSEDFVIESVVKEKAPRKIKAASTSSKISEVLQNYRWFCTICESSILNSLKDLIEHYKSQHDKPAIFKCNHCGRQYDRYRSFTKHYLLHEDPKKFECDTCGKIFNLKSSLISHRIVHTKDRPYSCSVCQKSFKSSATLSNHKKLHLPNDVRIKFVCKMCDKEFSSKKSLDNHEKMHAGELDFMCDVCGKSFVAKNSLAYHLASHSLERNHLCSVCGRVFRTERLLKKHSIAHTEEKSYRCNVCGKKFREKGTLMAHSRIHTGEMPFSCEHCGKKFRFTGILTIHRRIHTGERPYACENCDKTFTNWANLNKHIRRVHRNNPESSGEQSNGTLMEGQLTFEDIQKVCDNL